MGEHVEVPETIDSVRAIVMSRHRYVTRQVGVTEGEGVVVVCTCGDNGEGADREEAAAWVEEHLDKALRARFAGTPFENQHGTRYLR